MMANSSFKAQFTHHPIFPCKSLIVAIDCGASNTCIAYTFVGDEKHRIYVINEDDCHGGPLHTTILFQEIDPYDGALRVINFGSTAQKMYICDQSFCDTDSSLSDTGDHDDNIHTHDQYMNRQIELLFYGYCRETEEEMNCVIPESIVCIIHHYTPKYTSTEWESEVPPLMLFESFTRALHQVSIPHTIPCVDERHCSLTSIFIETFKYIHRFFQHNIARMARKEGDCPIPNRDEIQWVLTVPASFSHIVVHQLAKWLTYAGLINKKIHNHLQFVYESDCVALAIGCFPEDIEDDSHDTDDSYDTDDSHDTDDLALAVGDRYIAIDAGAETIAISWCQLNEEHSIEEIHHATSGPWGSDHIDDHFESLLVDVFGEYAMKRFKSCYPQSYVELKQSFNVSKKLFDGTRSVINVQMPFNFVYYIGEYAAIHCNIDIDEYYDEEDEALCEILNTFGLGTGQLWVEDDILCISTKIWKEYLFDKVIDPMIDHIASVIPIVNQNEKSIKYAFISGGFAQSEYLQKRIKTALNPYDIITKVTRQHCVLQGAIKLALQPGCITIKKSNLTYGSLVDRCETAVDASSLPDGYLEQNRYIHQRSKKRMIRNLFSVFIRKNDIIRYGEPFKKILRRFHKKERRYRLRIYASNKIDPYVKDLDVVELGHFDVSFPLSYKKLQFGIEIFFSDPKITANVLYFTDSENANAREGMLNLVYQ
eukprot:48157_1